MKKMDTFTTGHLLRHWAQTRPEHVALRSTAGSITYAQLDKRTNQVAQALKAEGVKAGDRVAYLDKNSPEQIELFFGAAKINAIPSPINYRLAPSEISVIVRDASPRLVFVGEEFLEPIESVRAELGGGVRLIVIGESSEHPSYRTWRDTGSAEDPGTMATADDIAYLLYSSGTTGRPKGVQLTQSNLMAVVKAFGPVLHLDGDSVSLVAMPLYHIGGGGWAYTGFSVGATNVLVRNIVPNELVGLLESECVSHAFLAPAVLQTLLNVPGIEERDFAALNTLLYGASPISEHTLSESVRTFGCRFVQAYGLTECTGGALYLPETDHDLTQLNPEHLRAIGLPLPEVDARIVDPESHVDKPIGEVGELWVRGPQVMKGYWGLPEATAEAIRPGGWLRTGDAGYQAHDGYFYLHDRIKDMIVSGAENIYPAEIENVLMAHPALRDAAVIGVPHEKWGETPLAFVVKRNGMDVTEAAVLAFCRASLAGYKCPSAVVFREELPRNPSGKLLKKDLRQPYWKGHQRFVN